MDKVLCCTIWGKKDYVSKADLNEMITSPYGFTLEGDHVI